MRENISSIRTKKMMVDALEELLQSKGIDKITVLDITKKCGINRQTFYYHFHDIYEPAEGISKSYTEEVLGKNVSIDKWDDAVLNVAEFILKKKKLVLSLMKTVGHHYITNFLFDYIKPYIKNIVETIPEGKDVDEKYADFISNYYTITFSGLLIEWLANELYKTTPPQELVRLLKITSDGTLRLGLKRYAEAVSDQSASTV